MSLHAEGTVLIIDESDTAQPAVVPAFFDANFDFGLSGYVHPDDTVRLVPVGNPVIDKGKYRDALDTIEETAVDADRFTASHGAGAVVARKRNPRFLRSEEHTSELQSLMRISYAVFCLKKKNTTRNNH